MIGYYQLDKREQRILEKVIQSLNGFTHEASKRILKNAIKLIKSDSIVTLKKIRKLYG